MKKVIYAILFLLISTALTSCVKEYTCQCEISFTGKPGLPEPYIRDYKMSNTFKEADQECTNRSRQYSDDGVITTERCELY